MDLGLKGKYAVVTGGAGGIGAGIVRVLADEGCNIVIGDLRADERTEAFADEIRALGVDVVVLKVNVGNCEETEAFYAELDKRNIRPDFLINNAGGGAPQGKSMEDVTYEEWYRAMDGCLNSVFFMSRPFVERCLKDGRKGKIVNVSAKAAFHSTSHDKIAYATAKGGVATITSRMANDFIEKGITVNSIVPGYVLSGFYDATKDDIEAIGRKKGLRIGWATPEDMGNIVAFLCSEKSKQIVGVNIDVSGGTML